jgi:hypothetical protein
MQSHWFFFRKVSSLKSHVSGLFVLILLCSFIGEGNSFFQNPAAVLNTDTSHAATDSILRSWLSNYTVDDAIPIGTTFYFWTSVAELDSVKESHMLLRKYSANDFLEHEYRLDLLNKKWDDHPIARILRGSDFSRVQNAWPCYWSMIAEYYEGDKNQLVKVELEDSALIAVFHPDRKKNSWAVYDMKGRSIGLPEVEKRKNQVAAIYFSAVYKDDRSRRIRPQRLKYPWRSFFLCNESMIRSWHHAVPGMQDRINKDAGYLLLLHAWFQANPATHELTAGRKGKRTARVWDHRSYASPAEYLMQTFRFSRINADHRTTATIIDMLRARWPLQVNPVERFPSRGMR